MLSKMTVIAIAFMAVAGLANDAAAFGGGGGGADGPVSGVFDGVAYQGTCSNGECSGTFEPNGTWYARIQTAEPLAGLFVGLGLLGARYLRRR